VAHIAHRQTQAFDLDAEADNLHDATLVAQRGRLRHQIAVAREIQNHD
jgi:hypothetical protein